MEVWCRHSTRERRCSCRSPSSWPTTSSTAGCAEGARAPSTNELAAFYRINPATAAKGINLLVDDGVLEKRRGIGMFVAAGAREQLRAHRRKQFAEQYLDPMLAEASRLGIDTDTLVSLIRGSGWHNGGEHAMTPTISATALGRRYRDQAALDDVSLAVEPGTVTGLLGRNGAGKTTLMRIVTGQEFPTSGAVRVFGQPRRRTTRCCAAWCSCARNRPTRTSAWATRSGWPRGSTRTGDQELAQQLLADFDLPPQRRIKKLSRGMRSAVGIVIGLAARAELTLFDEPYAGLDAVARQLFYDRLLADFAEHPRTVVLSTHLIDEVADLLEHVVMLDRGRVVLDAPADDVRGTGHDGQRTGHRPWRSSWRGAPVWHRQRLGSRASVTSPGPLDVAAQARARALHLSLEPLSLQQLLVHASGSSADEKVSA